MWSTNQFHLIESPPEDSMNVHWVDELTDEERATSRQFISGGSTRVRKSKRAQVLLVLLKMAISGCGRHGLSL